MKNFVRITAGAAFILCLSIQAQAAGGSGTMNEQMFQELKNMIQQQQAQLNQQAAEIADLKTKLSGNTETLATMADKEEAEGLDKMVTSKLSNVNLSLYGQFNRAALYADNGDSSNWYFVDNINSQTRLGLLASAPLGNSWVAGGRIEYGIVSFASSDASQINNVDGSGADDFKLRWAEVSFANDSYGKLSLGKGATASEDSTEVDLSGTFVASYSGFSDMAGSIFWNDGTPITGNPTIGDTFNPFDGLGRRDRLRYDTPSFQGLSLASAVSSGDAYDVALLYSRKYGGTKVAAVIAAAKPGDLNEDADAIYSGSASVLLPMGFNATFAAGYLDREDPTRDSPSNWWTKLGYRTKFYDAATTSFSIDYGETSDLAADGDTAKSWAVAAVHDISDWGTEVYMAYRGHKLDRNVGDFDDIHTFWTGARVKF